MEWRRSLSFTKVQHASDQLLARAGLAVTVELVGATVSISFKTLRNGALFPDDLAEVVLGSGLASIRSNNPKTWSRGPGAFR